MKMSGDTMLTSIGAIILSSNLVCAGPADEILQQAKAACEQVKTLSYSGVRTGYGTEAGRLLATNEVLLEKADGEHLNFWVNAQAEMSVYGYDEPYRSDVRFDGTHLVYTDFVEQVQKSGDARYRFDRMVLLDPCTTVYIAEIVTPSLFDTLIARGATLAGATHAGGVHCDYIRINHQEGAPEGTYTYMAIGQRDHLPRRVEYWTQTEAGAGLVAMELFDLKTNVDAPDEQFAPVARADFAQERLGLIVGTPAPPLTLDDGHGGTFDLASERGHVVLLDFWATWCAPCLASLPAMSELQDELADQGLVVVGVNVMESASSADAAAVFAKRGGTYRTFSASDQIAQNFRVTGLPTIVVVSKTGQVAAYWIGAGPDVHERLLAIVKRELDR